MVGSVVSTSEAKHNDECARSISDIESDVGFTASANTHTLKCDVYRVQNDLKNIESLTVNVNNNKVTSHLEN